MTEKTGFIRTKVQENYSTQMLRTPNLKLSTQMFAIETEILHFGLVIYLFFK